MGIYTKLLRENIYINEFDLSSTLNNLKIKIKRSILSLIDRIQDQIKKMKESKIKTALLKILDKAKKLLNKCNNINSVEEANNIKNEADNLNEEFKNTINNSDVLTSDFKEAVKNKNKIRVRIMIKDAMIWYGANKTSFSEVYTMINYASKHIENLFDEEDNLIELVNNESKWNEDYMNKLLVHLVNNFSKEKIKLLEKIIGYLYN